GGPTRGGEFILALSPSLLSGSNDPARNEEFLQQFEAIPGARLPGARRHRKRRKPGPRQIDGDLLAKIQALM
ncbi:MAG: hypothetical protein RIC89_08390, partial [Pseudomonadales bacterium]